MLRWNKCIYLTLIKVLKQEQLTRLRPNSKSKSVTLGCKVTHN